MEKKNTYISTEKYHFVVIPRTRKSQKMFRKQDVLPGRYINIPSQKRPMKLQRFERENNRTTQRTHLIGSYFAGFRCGWNFMCIQLSLLSSVFGVGVNGKKVYSELRMRGLLERTEQKWWVSGEIKWNSVLWLIFSWIFSLSLRLSTICSNFSYVLS